MRIIPGPLLLIIAVLFTVLISVLSGVTYAQDTSPVATPTVEAPQPPAPPDDEPVPIPPTLLELIIKLITEGGVQLVAVVGIVVGIAEKEVVSFVRRRFPNHKGTATRINGGIAQIAAAVTAIAAALITFGVTWFTGYVSSADFLLGLAGLATGIFASGWTVHKADKVSSIARGLKLLTEMSK